MNNHTSLCLLLTGRRRFNIFNIPNSILLFRLIFVLLYRDNLILRLVWFIQFDLQSLSARYRPRRIQLVANTDCLRQEKSPRKRTLLITLVFSVYKATHVHSIANLESQVKYTVMIVQTPTMTSHFIVVIMASVWALMLVEWGTRPDSSMIIEASC